MGEILMARPIIVTGAAGFIGRNVVAELNRRGEQEILLVDELGKDEKWKNLVGLRYEEIVSPEEFLGMIEDGAFADARSLIHLGACSATTEKDADYLLRNNYQYTRVLCNWAQANEIRFVYASSAATYGDGAFGYDDADAVTPTLKPLNMYGYSKHMFDLWALKHGLFETIVGLKYFNVFGEYEDHKGDMRSVVNKSFDQIREAGVVKLFKRCRCGTRRVGCSTAVRACRVRGLIWCRRCLLRWAWRRRSSSSRCRRHCRASTSTLRRLIRRSCVRRGMRSRLRVWKRA
jgi:ADP-L-glycero-D-manno-heptose 6-epimerase